MIIIKNVHKHFGAQKVLEGMSLEIETGSSIAVVGPSGTGKSVLLKIITGLLPADGGEVTIGNDSMTAARNDAERQRLREKMGILFQGAALFDSMTLFDNVAFPLRMRRTCSRKEIVSRVLRRLEEVGLRGYECALPGEVSIGMRKRVGIARALISEPDILLFDEPNTGLDPGVGQEIYELIQETQKICGFTGIVISHEIPEVFQVCNRVALLYAGKVQFEGTVPEFVACELPVVRQFIRGEVTGPIQMN